MKLNVKGFITCKGAELYSDCADNYAFNSFNHKFAISDGVSKSFFPKIWSSILVNQYVNKNLIDEATFIRDCQREWSGIIEGLVNRPETKWFTRAEFNRRTPALATFASLQFSENGQSWSASAIGDSFVFFIPTNYINFPERFIVLPNKSFPPVFDNFPDYLGSVGNQHKGLPQQLIKDQDLLPGTFYLMTDALAEWFVLEKENAAIEIKSWKDNRDFENFVKIARKDGSLKDDDSAMLVIEIEQDNQSALSYATISLTDLAGLVIDEETTYQDIQAEIPVDKILETELEKVEILPSSVEYLEQSIKPIRQVNDEEGTVAKKKSIG